MLLLKTGVLYGEKNSFEGVVPMFVGDCETLMQKWSELDARKAEPFIVYVQGDSLKINGKEVDKSSILNHILIPSPDQHYNECGRSKSVKLSKLGNENMSDWKEFNKTEDIVVDFHLSNTQPVRMSCFDIMKEESVYVLSDDRDGVFIGGLSITRELMPIQKIIAGEKGYVFTIDAVQICEIYLGSGYSYGFLSLIERIVLNDLQAMKALYVSSGLPFNYNVKANCISKSGLVFVKKVNKIIQDCWDEVLLK